MIRITSMAAVLLLSLVLASCSSITVIDVPVAEASQTPAPNMCAKDVTADNVDEMAGLYMGEVDSLVIAEREGDGQIIIQSYQDGTATVEITVEDTLIDEFTRITGQSSDLIVIDELGRFMPVSGVAARSMMSEAAKQQVLDMTNGYCPVAYLFSSYIDDDQLETLDT